ncbi:proton-conducting transporter transmembrane domain-containing protein [Streptomyces litchfieldiae]|uniref:Proton-conducting transporter membrane subunit n=1 Tax=Streptomyces litchfieldiae TaxID=3075543 RepID=A0ABU2MLC0_9ACTN|nr:proton-conducting transporter membrane subunit [Streptomyces sp. DSM 44938]MDT0342325.1 proton-conducting transporter membrane subunit [Streptomyces sp. DSM 44938]
MRVLVSLPVLLPLLAAGCSLVLARHTTAQRLLTVVVLTAVLADAVALLVAVHRDGPARVAVGGWPPPLGIALAADLLSALLLTVGVLVALAVLLFAIGQGTSERSGETAVPFHPAYLMLVGGVGLAFLTGDLFNLFVAFEVMLASSYVLITLNAGEARVRAGMTYTMTSLTSSLLFLTAVALVYAATGTVALDELGRRTAGLDEGVRAALGAFLLCVFAIKAAVVPLHFWLPDGYPTAPAPITAVFAALLTKVGVYAMIRTQAELFPREDTWWLVAGAAMLTMLVGILGAIAQDDINRLLSFTLVSHIGFMLFGLSLFDVAGFTGTILYIVHHIVVQAGLFLVTGLVVARTGTAKLHLMEPADGGPERGTPPVITALFLLPALSMAGIPPFSGFIAKFALLRAAAAHGGVAAYAVAATALLTSLLTLYALLRVWRALSAPAPGPPASPVLTVGATAGMVLVGLALAAGAGPLAELSERAATDLLAR